MSPTHAADAPGTGRTPNTADRDWLALACELAALCPPSTTAFSVGAVIVAADGTELARAYSRESNPTTTPRKAPSPNSPPTMPDSPPPRSTAPWSPAPSGHPALSPVPSSSGTPASAVSSPPGASPTSSSQAQKVLSSSKGPT